MSKCRTCGATIFKAVPGKTTQEEIRKFARRSKLNSAEEIITDGWIHPGEYCPNGCTWVLIEYRGDNFEKESEQRFLQTYSCHVAVIGGTTLPHPLSLSNYKIYIDGNIAQTRMSDKKPVNGEFVRIAPGDHRIVVRESDVKKPNRLESNTIRFNASEGASLHFEVGMALEHLELIKR